MKSFALASGSSGNCFCIKTKNKTFLVDLGISFSRIKETLETRNISINDIDAVFITHEHSDHCIGLSTFLKNSNCPIYMSKGTKSALNLTEEQIIETKNHQIIIIDGIRIFCIEKPHDANEALSFIFEKNGKKIGIFTDMGHVTDQIKHIIKSLDILYIEANYCENCIKKKKHSLNQNYLNRLMSNLGHLGLHQTIEALLQTCNHNQKIILSHISQNTNYYENAYLQIKTALFNANLQPEILVSFQNEPTEWIE